MEMIDGDGHLSQSAAGKLWRAQKASHFKKRVHLLIAGCTNNSSAGTLGDNTALLAVLAQLEADSTDVDGLADRQANGAAEAPWWADGEYDTAEAER